MARLRHQQEHSLERGVGEEEEEEEEEEGGEEICRCLFGSVNKRAKKMQSFDGMISRRRRTRRRPDASGEDED